MPWLSKMMLADLTQLAKLPPFSNKNLIDHIVRNQPAWKKFHGQRDAPLRFKDLPNRTLLDFHLLLTDEADQGIDQAGLEEDEPIQEQQLSQVPSLEKAEKDTMNSERAGTRADISRSSMKRTESEILNDPDIWNVSESEDDPESDADDDLGNSKRASGNDHKKTVEAAAETKE